MIHEQEMKWVMKSKREDIQDVCGIQETANTLAEVNDLLHRLEETRVYASDEAKQAVGASVYYLKNAKYSLLDVLSTFVSIKEGA